jgi:dCMP deaminase
MTDKWEHRFLDLARLISSWSKDPSTQVGAVIVRPDRTIVSCGYNGFPRLMPDGFTTREDKLSRTIHGEINALLTAREPVHGCTLYTWPFLSCDRCFVQLVQAGITTFIAPVNKDPRWEEAFARVRKYAAEINKQNAGRTVITVKEIGIYDDD